MQRQSWSTFWQRFPSDSPATVAYIVICTVDRVALIKLIYGEYRPRNVRVTADHYMLRGLFTKLPSSAGSEIYFVAERSSSATRRICQTLQLLPIEVREDGALHLLSRHNIRIAYSTAASNSDVMQKCQSNFHRLTFIFFRK
jgi:hypothetical protein